MLQRFFSNAFSNALFYMSMALLHTMARIPVSWMRFMARCVMLGLSVLPMRFFQNARQNYQQSMRITHLPWHWTLRHAWHLGGMMGELPYVWLHPKAPTRVEWDDAAQEKIHADLAAQHGICLLTPHLGSFEVFPRFMAHFLMQHASHKKVYVMYKKPRIAFFARIIRHIRQTTGIVLVEANAAGAKILLAALKKGHIVAGLPDQVPPMPGGLWVPFFGQNAYTPKIFCGCMIKAQAASYTFAIHAKTLIGTPEKIWHISIKDFYMPADADLSTLLTQLNIELEEWIRMQHMAYLWGYNRYKSP